MLHKPDPNAHNIEALKALASVLRLGGVVSGVTPLAELAGVGGKITGLLDFMSKRQAKRRADRLEQIVYGILLRLGSSTSTTEQTEEQEDLFYSVLEDAIQEDEAAKLPLYSSFLAWMLKSKPDALSVKVLGEMLQNATYFELWIVHQMILHDRTIKPTTLHTTVYSEMTIPIPEIYSAMHPSSFVDRLKSINLYQFKSTSEVDENYATGQRLASIIWEVSESERNQVQMSMAVHSAMVKLAPELQSIQPANQYGIIFQDVRALASSSPSLTSEQAEELVRQYIQRIKSERA